MKKYVVRVLRKDGTLYDEVFFEALNNEYAIFHFKHWNTCWGKSKYNYELRSYGNGRTGKRIICQII